MEKKYYRESLIEAVNKLNAFRNELFHSLFNVAMAGELYDWNRTAEIGDVYEFDHEIFKGCDDINIQLLIGVDNKIEEIIESLCNLNRIEITSA